MVIPDPDTPFLRSVEVSDDELEASTSSGRFHIEDPSDMMSKAIKEHDSQNERDEKKSREFAEKRRAFYNEIRVLKGLEKPPNPPDPSPEH